MEFWCEPWTGNRCGGGEDSGAYGVLGSLGRAVDLGVWKNDYGSFPVGVSFDCYFHGRIEVNSDGWSRGLASLDRG